MTNEVEELFKEDVVPDLTFAEILALYRGEEGQEIYRPLIYQGIIRETEIQSVGRGSEISIQGWQHDMAFSATDHDTVAWASGTITLLDGTTYSITGANTGTMSAITYIYLDIATSETTLQTTTTPATAIGTGKIMVAVAQNVASGKKALFQVFGGKALGGAGKLWTAEDIAANTITANEIYANTITASEISKGLYTEINSNLPSDENLVGYWAFDEGAGDKAYDGSGNTNHGTLTNMEAADWVDGMAGSCLDLGGTDEYVVISDDTSIQLTSAIAISCWIYPTNITGNHEIASKYGGSYNGWILRVDDGQIRFYVSTPSEIPYAYKSGISADTWYHIIATWDGTTANVYIDGVVGTSASPSAMTDSGADMAIGRSSWADQYHFIGKIDEFRMFKTGLTAKEAYALYKNPSGQPSLAVPIGRLTTGYIYSKQIRLAMTGGTGDSLIYGGESDDWATDLAAWQGGNATGGAFLLGLDDSDSDKAKFFIGNHSTNEYMKFDTDLRTTGLKLLHSFTAGEAITAGRLIQYGLPSETTVYTSADAGTREDNADVTYNGDTSDMYLGKTVGADEREVYLKFRDTDLPTRFIWKATLYIHQYQQTGAGGTFKLYSISADWAETTITWNNIPATFADSVVPYTDSYTLDDNNEWHSIDITQQIRNIWAEGRTWYGFRLKAATSAGTQSGVNSKEYPTADTYKAYIIFEHLPYDEKIYHGDYSSYMGCRNLIGTAAEAISDGNAGKVQVGGKATNASGINAGMEYQPVYLRGANGEIGIHGGAYNEYIRKTEWSVEVGNALSTTELLINIRKLEPFLIEKLTSISITTGNTETFYVPPWASKIVFKYDMTTTGDQGIATVYRHELNSVVVEKDANETFTMDWTNAKGTNFTLSPTNTTITGTLYIYE